VVRDERVIHLLAVSKAPLFAVLSERVRARALVRWWTDPPSSALVKPGDALVVDLLDGGPTVKPALLVPALQHVKAWLVTGKKPVAPGWLDFVIQGGARVVRCHCTTGGFESLITGLESALRGPQLERIAALVLEEEPRFASMAGIVHALLDHPWEARHPGQLAVLAGVRHSALRNACRDLCFHRVEHFMIVVRTIAAKQLAARHEVPLQVAWRVAGLGDASNVSKQVRRARAGSPDALRTLASFGTQP
jgi:hypothetical protein